MPARRLLVSTLALLVPTTLLTWSAPVATADDGEVVAPHVSVRVVGGQRIRLEALPQVVQFGGQVADPDHASAAITATIRPVRVGRRVQLQVREGDVWRQVGTRRQDARGRAEFAATAAVDGEALAYRVKAMAFRGLRSRTSAPVSTARWLEATWTDEFSGTELARQWSSRSPEHGQSNRRSCSRGDRRAVSVGGGAVRLSVLVDPDATTRCRIRGRDAVPGRFAYRLNGHVGTQGEFSFRYGVAAARVKFHRLRGQHGAFWLQPTGGMYPGALGSEIDVVEYFGDHHPQGGLATFMHRYDGRRRVSTGGWISNSASYLRSRRDGWSRNYHVFSVEWTPRRLVYRIDGRETARMTRGVSAERQFPILSLIASDYEIPKIRERQLPQHMYVDWIRVWETGT
ncbi:glycoside hydrolase family 16 protein [Nocardioides sp.]|uniref:glycoside hydrolase family 16 protein n=1 Tax=Nocardioides sp. TaxID=35761 RepID=UPI0035B3664C